MKNRLIQILTLLTISLLISASDQPAEKKITVAVYPLKVLASDKSFESLGPVLTSFLVTTLSKSTKLKVTEQEMTAEVEKQLEFANSDKCDATMCPIPEIGKALAAQKLVVGQVAKLGQKYTTNIRVIDIEQKVIDFSVDEQMVCKEEDLDQLMELAAWDIREKFGEKVERPKPVVQPQPQSPPQLQPQISFSPARPASSPAEEQLASHNILGIEVENDPGAAKNFGSAVRVKSVLADSPCKDIFKPQDIIISLGAPNNSVSSMDDFIKAVSTIKPGDKVLVGTFHKMGAVGRNYSCTIPAQSQAQAPINAPDASPYPYATPESKNLLGIAVKQDNPNRGENNVRIESVDPGSPCKDFLKEGYYIVAMNPSGPIPPSTNKSIKWDHEYNISTVENFKGLVQRIKPGAGVGIVVCVWNGKLSGWKCHDQEICEIP